MLNIWGRDEKYQRSFLMMTYQVLTMIHDERPDVKLNKGEFLKICFDYFEALLRRYMEMKNTSPMPNQICSLFAFQAFEDFVILNFESFGAYIDMLKIPVIKPKEEKLPDENSIVTIKETGIDGLTELIFNYPEP